MYATVTELREEGVTDAQATDARLTLLIDEASRVIDRLTGWFFEPRTATFRLDGRGTASVEPPAPSIVLNSLIVEDRPTSLEPQDLQVVGSPVQPGFDAPRFTLCRGGVFPKGAGNILANGTWGYTEDDGTPLGRTPLTIRRACKLIVLRNLPRLGEADEAAEAQNRWRIVEEKTRDQSYKLARLSTSEPIIVEPEVDRILMRYRRPLGLGAA